MIFTSKSNTAALSFGDGRGLPLPRSTVQTAQACLPGESVVSVQPGIEVASKFVSATESTLHISAFKDLPVIQAVLSHGRSAVINLEDVLLGSGSTAALSMVALDVGLQKAWILVEAGRMHELQAVLATLRGRITQSGRLVERVLTCDQAVIADVLRDWNSNVHAQLDVARSAGFATLKAWLQIAVAEKASDLMLIRSGTKGLVRIRVNGEMEPLPGPQGGVFALDVVSSAIADTYNLGRKASSGSKSDFHFEEGAYAMIPSEKLGLPLRLRYQYIANVHGGSCELRILPEGSSGGFSSGNGSGSGTGTGTSTRTSSGFAAGVATRTLVDAGLAANGHVDEITQACRAMRGGVTLAGGTGSGKSTVIATIFTTIIDPSKINAYEFGDPIEILNPEILQVSAKRDVSDADDTSDFRRFKAEVMRGDPDVIIIGETRDHDTRSLFEHGALSNHLTFTTLHTGSIVDIAQRYAQKEIGLDRDKMGSPSLLSALVFLALVPLLCGSCKLSATEVLGLKSDSAEHLHCQGLVLATHDKTRLEPERFYFRRTGGCPVCKGRGTVGVTNLAEVYRPNAQWRKFTRAGLDDEAFDVFRQETDGNLLSDDFHGKPAFLHGLVKAARGEVDLRSLQSFADLRRFEFRERI